MFVPRLLLRVWQACRQGTQGRLALAVLERMQEDGMSFMHAMVGYRRALLCNLCKEKPFAIIGGGCRHKFKMSSMATTSNQHSEKIELIQLIEHAKTKM